MSWTGECCLRGSTNGVSNGALPCPLEGPARHWGDCHSASCIGNLPRRLHTSSLTPLLHLPLCLNLCSDDPDAVDPKARLRWDGSSSSKQQQKGWAVPRLCMHPASRQRLHAAIYKLPAPSWLLRTCCAHATPLCCAPGRKCGLKPRLQASATQLAALAWPHTSTPARFPAGASAAGYARHLTLQRTLLVNPSCPPLSEPLPCHSFLLPRVP